MKIQIKDLKPNPFRDMKNYPINEEKVQSLTNSINQTGFWDNILVRPKPGYTFWTKQIDDGEELDEMNAPCYMHITYDENGEEEDYDDPIFEIAYGHHRLIVLKKLFKPDDYVDIPVRELDDSMMIRIMANENDENWGTSPKIIDETVRVTKKFLEEHKKIIPAISVENANGIIGCKIISDFLNGNWNISRVHHSLERLGLIEKEELDKEAIESLPTERAARDFVKATKQIKNITPEQQREAAKSIIRDQSFGESSVKSALLDEKYKDMEPEKSEREKVRIKARDFVHGITKDLEKINEKIGELIKRKSEPNFDVYEDCIEAEEFRCEVEIFISNLKKLGGEK
jgi:hypothetical protein